MIREPSFIQKLFYYTAGVLLILGSAFGCRATKTDRASQLSGLRVATDDVILTISSKMKLPDKTLEGTDGKNACAIHLVGATIWIVDYNAATLNIPGASLPMVWEYRGEQDHSLFRTNIGNSLANGSQRFLTLVSILASVPETISRGRKGMSDVEGRLWSQYSKELMAHESVGFKAECVQASFSGVFELTTLGRKKLLPD